MCFTGSDSGIPWCPTATHSKGLSFMCMLPVVDMNRHSLGKKCAFQSTYLHWHPAWLSSLLFLEQVISTLARSGRTQACMCLLLSVLGKRAARQCLHVLLCGKEQDHDSRP